MGFFVSKILNMDLDVCEVAGSTETETEQLAKKVITAAGISQLKVTFRGTTSSLPTKLSQNMTQDFPFCTHSRVAERLQAP